MRVAHGHFLLGWGQIRLASTDGRKGSQQCVTGGFRPTMDFSTRSAVTTEAAIAMQSFLHFYCIFSCLHRREADFFHLMQFYTRIAYNTKGWQRPSGTARNLEEKGSFSVLYGFGFEEWLFRPGWEIEGWRYGFLQGVNKGTKSGSKQALARQKQPHEVTLFTRLPDASHALVARIKGMEFLDRDLWKDAMAIYDANGWLKQMDSEVVAANGNSSVLYSNDYADEILNVRYRPENLEQLATPYVVRNDDWVNRRWRYSLYRLDDAQHTMLGSRFA